MRLSLDLARKIPCPLPKAFFERVGEETLGKSDIDAVADADVSLSVALISLDEIRELNRTYRKKNRTTDVLSFGNHRRRDEIVPGPDGTIDIGELVLSPEYVADAAREDGVSLDREMAYIFSHGVLHLLGYRHSPRMFAIQDEIASRYH